jgi:hypothetical protein
MRPQAPPFEAHIPILMVVGDGAGLRIIAEGRGWPISDPPELGAQVYLASSDGILGGRVLTFAPQQGGGA